MVEINDQQNRILKKDDRSSAKLVAKWLVDIDLKPYYPLFIRNGYDSLKTIKTIQSKEDLAEMGVMILRHQSVIMTEIKKLQQQREESNMPPPSIPSANAQLANGSENIP